MLGRDVQTTGSDAGERRLAIAVAVAMLTGAFVAVAGSSTAWHSSDPVIYEETADGAAGFGVSGTLEEAGDLAVAATGWAPVESSQISAGIVVFDEDENQRFMFAFTGHGSPDRTIVEPSPVEPTASGSWDEGSWSTHVQGDTSVLEDHDIRVEVAPAGGPSPASEHAVIRVATTAVDADPGPFHRAVWVGDVAETTLQIETQSSTSSIETTQGDAYVLGDPEIEDGQPNIQFQESEEAPTTVGVKVMNDASVDVDAEHGLYGFWGLSDFKLACQFSAGACLWTSSVYSVCGLAGASDCTGQISWEGPDSSGEGDGLYSLEGTQAGPHTFTVDHKIDLYGPSEYDTQTGTYVSLGEHFSYLTVADVQLP
jgi:hypothetical protein